MKYYQFNAMFFLVLSVLVMLSIRILVSNMVSRQIHLDLSAYTCKEISDDSIAIIQKSKRVEEIEKMNTDQNHRIKNAGRVNRGRKKVDYKIDLPDPLDINRAVKEDFMRLSGIGEVLSTRILKFRKKLGGFHSVNQIADVYGLSDETFGSIKSLLKCNGEVDQINLNETSFKELLSHPYLNYEEVKGIKNFLQKKGSISDAETLIKVTNKSQEDAWKLIPYVLTPVDKS